MKQALLILSLNIGSGLGDRGADQGRSQRFQK